MKVAYCDCFSGISGDMFLGALFDVGLPMEILQDGLSRLGIENEFELSAQETHKGSLRATQFKVILKHQDHHHHHQVVHEHDHDHHHRKLVDITNLISQSGLSSRVQETSLAILNNLANAEARTHGQPVEEVHFHEVGAVDSIIDIVGAAIGLEWLGIEQLYASSLPLGNGQIESAHGTLPLPAPATLQILADAQAPTHHMPTEAELVTPTGAALLTALAMFEQPAMVLEKIGVGSGERDLSWPNIFRLWVGELPNGVSKRLSLLETNIDDMNPEFFGYVMERLFEAGALDVFMTPIYMKKNRPGTILSVIARDENKPELASILLTETSTLGVRSQPIHRYEADRVNQSVNTPYGEIPVKLKVLEGKIVSISPEYDACSALAKQQRVALIHVYNAAVQAGLQLQGGTI